MESKELAALKSINFSLRSNRLTRYDLKIPDLLEQFIRSQLQEFDFDTVTEDTVVPWLHIDPATRFYIPEPVEDYVSGGRLAIAACKIAKNVAAERGNAVSMLSSQQPGELEIWYQGGNPERHKLLSRVRPSELYHFINTVTFGRW